MCHLKERYKRKTVTGWKVAIHENGKLLSPATLIEYKVGPVTSREYSKELEVKRFGEYCQYFYFGLLDQRDSCAFSTKMTGRTAVFTEKINAVSFFKVLEKRTNEDKKLVLIRVTLSGDLLKGKYDWSEVVAGKHIDKVKIVRRK